MEFNLKNHQASKIKKDLKLNNFILLSYGANQNSSNWITTEQELYNLDLSYYKVYNNIVVKEIKKTTLKKFLKLISSTLFLLKPSKIADRSTQLGNKNTLIKNLLNIRFDVHSLKLNNKIYSMPQLRNNNSFKYKISIKILYQFLTTHVKSLLVVSVKKS